MRIARLMCAVQQGGAGKPLSIVAFDGNAWTAPKVVAGSSLKTPPELVRFGETLWCLHQDAETKGNLFALTFDGTSWSDEALAVANAMTAAPAAAVLAGRLYAVHQGYAASHALTFESTADGRSWTATAPLPVTTKVAASTAAAAFGGSLYAFYNNLQGIGWSQIMYVTLSASGSWRGPSAVPGQVGIMASTPSVAVFEGRLYVCYALASKQLCCASFDGDRWEPAQPVPGTSGQVAGGTAAVAFEGLLYVLYRSSAGSLAYATFDGSAWRGPASAGSFTIANDPAAAVY